MALKLSFVKLSNMTSGDNYLLKNSTVIQMTEYDESTCTIELGRQSIAVGNLILVQFKFIHDQQETKISFTGKVQNSNIFQQSARMRLKFVQFNRNQWSQFMRLMHEQKTSHKPQIEPAKAKVG